jgi:2-deoxy-D-gluconate 3-dehydrogenase
MVRAPERQEYVSLAELLNLEGKVAIVTGGGMGIGHGIVTRLSEAGATMVIADRNMEAAEAVVTEIRERGRQAMAVHCDVTKEEDIKRMVAEAVREYGHVDVLVNNAGIYPFTPAMQLKVEDWDRIQNINLRGTFLFNRAFTEQAAKQGSGGAIVNIGSIDSIHPTMVGLAAYDASKGRVLMFTKNFALEAAQYGVRVNMIAPGGIATEGTTKGLRPLHSS